MLTIAIARMIWVRPRAAARSLIPGASSVVSSVRRKIPVVKVTAQRGTSHFGSFMSSGIKCSLLTSLSHIPSLLPKPLRWLIICSCRKRSSTLALQAEMFPNIHYDLAKKPVLARSEWKASVDNFYTLCSYDFSLRLHLYCLVCSFHSEFRLLYEN